MGMNPSMVLQSIEKNLGATFQVLELSNEDILDIVVNETIPTFSLYYPFYTLIQIDPYKDAVPNRFNTFYIKTDLDIIGVSKIMAENYMGNGGLPMAFYDSDPVNRQMTADVASMYLQPITFDFEEPNIVSVYPKTQLMGKFMLEIKTVHPSHMATIPLALRSDFLEMALYDVRIALYPIRHKFQTINTTFGSIELFMDKLESAQDDKKTLMDKWRSNFSKSSKRRKMFIG